MFVLVGALIGVNSGSCAGRLESTTLSGVSRGDRGGGINRR
jgi:hypothetical protein